MTSTHVESVTEVPVRVLSWNIHKGIGGLDRQYDLQRTISALQYYAPDVVLLQEVAQGIGRLNFHDQVELLQQSLEMHSAFHLEHRFRSGAYGNLVLSRWPLHSTTHLDLRIGWRKQRGVLQTHLKISAGTHHRTLVVNNLHLGLAGSERRQQLTRFTSSRALQQLRHDTPIIVGGDFNDVWGGLGDAHLLPLGFARAGTLAKTFPSVIPMRPLDGLFYRGHIALRHFAVAKLRLARAASDHLPIYADFILPVGHQQ